MSLSPTNGDGAMVDAKYRAVYNQPSKFRAMSVDKRIQPDYHDTPEQAFTEYLAWKSEDFLIVETFPGSRKFPCFGDDVKEDCE